MTQATSPTNQPVQPPNRLVHGLDWHLDRVPQTWQPALETPQSQAALDKLRTLLDERLAAGATIFPGEPFRALHLTPPDTVNVVILGQDPYHGPGQAHGLAFSVPDNVPCPPSLRNILKERNNNFPERPPRRQHDLSDWAKKGVLLLNTALTVEQGKAASHSGLGWEAVTDALIQHVLTFSAPKVFMLWGRHAQQKEPLIQTHATGPVLTLKSNHPSPLSANRPPVPFIGCGHFRQAAVWLKEHGSA